MIQAVYRELLISLQYSTHQLFFDKVMVKHGMNLLKKITEFLNPGQITIISCGCPIFAHCKYIQWQWPKDFSENNFIVMLRVLHAEKALLICLKHLLASSGWTAVWWPR